MADSEKSKSAKPFRWLGEHGPNDDRKGVLHIVLKDARRIVVFPGQIIKDIEHLAAVGAERIAELVKEGKAEMVEVLEKLGIGKVDKVSSDSSDAEIESAQNAASEASARGSAAQKLGNAQAERGKGSDSRVSGEVPTAAGRTEGTPATTPPAEATVEQPAGPSGQSQQQGA